MPGYGDEHVRSAPYVTGAGCMAHGDLVDTRGVSDEQCMFFDVDLVCVWKCEIGCEVSR